MKTEPKKGVPPEYLEINPLGKVPGFQGNDGFILSECIAIGVYSKYSYFYYQFIELQLASMMRYVTIYS